MHKRSRRFCGAQLLRTVPVGIKPTASAAVEAFPCRFDRLGVFHQIAAKFQSNYGETGMQFRKRGRHVLAKRTAPRNDMDQEPRSGIKFRQFARSAAGIPEVLGRVREKITDAPPI